jgi:hypothetical protein
MRQPYSHRMKSHACWRPRTPDLVSAVTVDPETMWSPRLYNLLKYYVLLYIRQIGALLNRYLS